MQWPARRQADEDFIKLYQSEPCLWQVKNKDYYNQEKRDAAYQKLLKQLQETEPAATKDHVLKKINNMRTAYRKQLRKIADSIISEAEEVCKPTLWYYPLLTFLQDQEVSLHNEEDEPQIESSMKIKEEIVEETDSNSADADSSTSANSQRASQHSFMEESQQSPVCGYQNNPAAASQQRQTASPHSHSAAQHIYAAAAPQQSQTANPHSHTAAQHIYAAAGSQQSQTVSQNSRTSSQHSSIHPSSSSNQQQSAMELLSSMSTNYDAAGGEPKRPFMTDPNDKTLENKTAKRLRPDTVPEDRFDLLGKLVATKLRALPPDRSLMLEKVIHDTLFDAEMNYLQMRTAVLPPSQHQQPYMYHYSAQQRHPSMRNAPYISGPVYGQPGPAGPVYGQPGPVPQQPPHNMRANGHCSKTPAGMTRDKS